LPKSTIRPAVPSDFEALQLIFDSWHRQLVSVNSSEQGWLVAEVMGVVAGGLLASEFCNWHQGLAGFGHLTEDDAVPFASLICVDEALRHRGVGSPTGHALDRFDAVVGAHSDARHQRRGSLAGRSRSVLQAAWLQVDADRLRGAKAMAHDASVGAVTSRGSAKALQTRPRTLWITGKPCSVRDTSSARFES
jgi:hypothetical protein